MKGRSGSVMLSIVLLVYGHQNSTNAIGKTSLFMMDSWIAFVNTLNPNRPSRKSLSPSPFHFTASHFSISSSADVAKIWNSS